MLDCQLCDTYGQKSKSAAFREGYILETAKPQRGKHSLWQLPITATQTPESPTPERGGNMAVSLSFKQLLKNQTKTGLLCEYSCP